LLLQIKMTGENTTLNDLQEELKAAQEKTDEHSAAFPSEFLIEKNLEILENNPVEKETKESGMTVCGATVTNAAEQNDIAGKRKAGNDNDFDNDETENKKNGNEDNSNKKKKLEEFICKECKFKCYTLNELSVHQTTTHGPRKKLKLCENCSYTSDNVWEMDFHCRSRGHKKKTDDAIPCKKCDYIAENKDDNWNHKKVHIPPEKLVECADCVWCGDRLDNIRYHIHSQGHNMKEDYEAIALAKAEAKGPKEVAHYKKKLAKDIKNAQKALKV